MNEPGTPPNKADRELDAIGTILGALDGLDGDSIQRVLDYVFSRLSIGRPSGSLPSSGISMHSSPGAGHGSPSIAKLVSIKDLKEEKAPESSNHMAALVAFYLTEVAPEGERRETVNTADIEKYFKQARFALPKRIQMTLPNASAAGYLDSVGNGAYKLNPVGYNLVAYGLPRSHKPGTGRRK